MASLIPLNYLTSATATTAMCGLSSVTALITVALISYGKGKLHAQYDYYGDLRENFQPNEQRNLKILGYTAIALGVLAGLVATAAAAASIVILGTLAATVFSPVVALTVSQVMATVIAGFALRLLYQAVSEAISPAPPRFHELINYNIED